MKGLLAGLVLGFALGAGVMHLARPELEPRQPPVAIRSPEPLRESPTHSESTPQAARPEPAPAPAPAVEAVRARYARRDPIPDLDDEQLLSCVRELLQPVHGLDSYELARIVGDEILRRPGLPISADLVDRLLASRDAALHRLGGRLLPRARPFRSERIAELAASHPSQNVRVAALGEWVRSAGRDERFLDVLLSAAKDSDTLVRSRAAGCLGAMASRYPEAAAWVVEAAAGRDAIVAGVAARHLDRAGEAGVSCAVRLLCEGEPSSSVVSDLVRVAVKGGRLRELLDRGVSARALRAALDALSNLDDEARARELDRVVGRFGELWERVRVLDEDPKLVFELAARAGDAAFLLRIATGAGSSPVERSTAVQSALWFPETVRAGLAGARSVLGDASTRPELRMEVLDRLEERLDFPDTDVEEVRAIVSGVAARDPSSEVREMAKEMLWGE